MRTEYIALFFICGISICLTNQFPIMKLTPKSSTTENFLTTNVCIGTPGDQCFELRLDFSSFYISVVNKTEKNKEKNYNTFICFLQVQKRNIDAAKVILQNSLIFPLIKIFSKRPANRASGKSPLCQAIFLKAVN